MRIARGNSPNHVVNIHGYTRSTLSEWMVSQMCLVIFEDGAVVGPTHLLQEELETPLAHVFALVLVLTEPSESELAHTCSDTLQKILQIRSMRAAMDLAPRVSVPCHVEEVADVSDRRRCHTRGGL